MTKSGKTREGYAVELYFDQESESQILALRERMYQLTAVTPVLSKLGDRPHISLAVFGCIDLQPLLECCKSFFADVRTMSIQLSAVGTFPTRDNVLFLSPVPSIPLLELHERFHKVLHRSGMKSSLYYLPGNWVPHCTIEFELTDEDLGKALTFFQRSFSSFSGKFTHAGVVGFRPVEYLADYELKG